MVEGLGEDAYRHVRHDLADLAVSVAGSTEPLHAGIGVNGPFLMRRRVEKNPYPGQKNTASGLDRSHGFFAAGR